MSRVQPSLDAMFAARRRYDAEYVSPKVVMVPDKLGVGVLRQHVDERVVFVHVGGITPSAQRMLQEHPRVEAFARSELQFDLMKHCLVPPTTLVSTDEVRRIGLVASELPTLLATDPVARWHAWGPGAVVRVTLTAPDGYTYDIYRTVR